MGNHENSFMRFWVKFVQIVFGSQYETFTPKIVEITYIGFSSMPKLTESFFFFFNLSNEYTVCFVASCFTASAQNSVANYESQAVFYPIFPFYDPILLRGPRSRDYRSFIIYTHEPLYVLNFSTKI